MIIVNCTFEFSSISTVLGGGFMKPGMPVGKGDFYQFQ